MADNYLITGYHGTPHITAENDRGINAGIFGTGRFVLSVGEQFRSEYIGNNIVRMYDGKLIDNGAAAGIPVGEYVDFLIPNASQGMKRNDLIVFQYERDASTLIERGSFLIVQGEETSETPTDPELTQENLLTNTASFDQMALFRVTVSDINISAPVKVFSVNTANQTQSEAHIQNKDNPHKVTKEQIGAAPSGFGLGTGCIDSISKVTDITKNGWWLINGDTPDGNWWMCLAFVTNAGADITIQAHSVKGNYSATRSKVDGVWQPWEWVNPPTNKGVEYRTTERLSGKPVYKKQVDFGYAPNNARKSKAHGCENVESVIEWSAFNVSSGTNVEQSEAVDAIYIDNTNIVMTTNSDKSTWDMRFIMKYTKTTD